ncbi:DMT family transporter [Verrucomicrobiaceae bacterium R5-34]|nr:DMT family transporter [Verrucomicrobiaceae bacterium R5-34]
MKITPPTSALMPAIVILGAFLFSSKGIVIKLMYAEGLSPASVLMLRMIIALPFYLVIAIILRKKLGAISSRDWCSIAALALLGYFLCSLVNMIGLQFISVGLERVILFCYPSVVLLGSAMVHRKRPAKALLAACLLSWIGLYLVIQDEIHFHDHASQVLLGSGLVFLSAVLYACYILISKPLIMRVGSEAYTSVVMCISCVWVLGYFATTESDIGALTASAKVLGYGVIIGVFGTVLPTYILSFGLSRIPATSYAVLSSAGPVTTIILSLAMAGQFPSGLQCAGVALSLTGSLLASQQR